LAALKKKNSGVVNLPEVRAAVPPIVRPVPASAAAEKSAAILPKIDLRQKPPLPEAPKPLLPSAPAAIPAVPKIAPGSEGKRMAAVAGNKKRMEDIKSAPKVMSPIDELAYMDMVTFRRLDASPARRAAKIEEKIALLEKEGLDKKIAAIKAWRFNPVSKTYLSMGEESISGGKSIDDIIKERKAQGLNYLSKEEFEAVMDLNDSLRF
jgi:hypothetical protein